MMSNSSATDLADATLYASQGSSNMMHKRALDILGSLVALILASPLLIGTALAVRLTSPGPIFFKQVRVGLDGREFEILKFRSMREDAEAWRSDVLFLSDRAGLAFKIKKDPRITSVGRFIRRYSIDELPQLFNVLRGDMSMVGPRPALPSEVAEYPSSAMVRLKTLPGITGIWQVSGRADVSFDQMIEMDSIYVHNAGVWLDIGLLLATFGAVFSGRGAY